MVVIDTNLLIYAHRARTPEHGAARLAIEAASRRADGWGLASPSIMEFWSVVTHQAADRPSTPGEARAFVEALADAGARLLSPSPASAQRVLELADRSGVTGPRVFDLHIAVVALDNGATEIWSHDRNFVTPPGLRLVDPITA